MKYLLYFPPRVSVGSRYEAQEHLEEDQHRAYTQYRPLLSVLRWTTIEFTCPRIRWLRGRNKLGIQGLLTYRESASGLAFCRSVSSSTFAYVDLHVANFPGLEPVAVPIRAPGFTTLRCCVAQDFRSPS
jgi:hypothetical protein